MIACAPHPPVLELPGAILSLSFWNQSIGRRYPGNAFDSVSNRARHPMITGKPFFSTNYPCSILFKHWSWDMSRNSINSQSVRMEERKRQICSMKSLLVNTISGKPDLLRCKIFHPILILRIFSGSKCVKQQFVRIHAEKFNYPDENIEGSNFDPSCISLEMSILEER